MSTCQVSVSASVRVQSCFLNAARHNSGVFFPFPLAIRFSKPFPPLKYFMSRSTAHSRTQRGVYIPGKSVKKSLKLFVYVSYGLWSDHVLGWWQHKDEKNILFLNYEDLKKNLTSQVRKIADFVGKPLSEKVVKGITTQCTFEGMSKNAPLYWVRDTAEGPSLLRKGIVGDWKNYFTPELNAMFENEFLTKLEGTGLQFDFE